MVFVTRAVRVCRIFDDNQLPLPGDGHDGVHVGRLAGEMDGDDRPRARCDGGRDRLGRQIERVQLNVRENGDGIGLDHCGRCREKGVRGNDDLVFSTDAGCLQRDPQRNRAVDDGDAVLAAVHRREAVFKFSHLRPVQSSPFAAAQGAKQSFLLWLADHRPSREPPLADGRSSQQREFLWHD